MDDVPIDPVLRDSVAEVSQARWDRDMSRLSDLRDKYDYPGLNTVEDNEVDKLLDRYEVDRVHWGRGDFPRD